MFFILCFKFVFMACAVYLRELFIFTVIFHFVCISQCKSIKSIDNNLYKKIIDAKSQQSPKLSIRYNAADKRVWRYCNNSFYRIKDGFKIVTSQTKRRVVSNNCYRSRNMTSIRLWYDIVTSYGGRGNAVSTSYVYWIFS